MPVRMATPTLSMQALPTSGPLKSNGAKCAAVSGNTKKGLGGNNGVGQRCKSGDSKGQTSVPLTNRQSTTVIKGNNGKSNEAKPSRQSSPQQPSTAKATPPDSRARRQVTEEVNEDSIYSIYLKKITYTFNNSLNKQANSSNYVTRCDQVDDSGTGEKSNSKWYDDQQVGARSLT